MMRDFDDCEPERKPSKKEQIASLTERAERLAWSNTEMAARHRADLDQRDRDLAAAGFLRVQDIVTVVAAADPWSGPRYTAEVSISHGSYVGLSDWRGRAAT